MFEVCQAAGLPLYWKAPIFAALTKNEVVEFLKNNGLS